jgi:hypothetical protein
LELGADERAYLTLSGKMSRDSQWSVGIQDATTHLMLKIGMQIISGSPKVRVPVGAIDLRQDLSNTSVAVVNLLDFDSSLLYHKHLGMLLKRAMSQTTVSCLSSL